MFPTLASLPTWILNSAAGRAHQVLHKHLAEAGFNGYDYRCLTALARQESMSQVELGAAVALDPRDITLTVRSLEGRGFVSRRKDATHGRRILVSLTKDGQNAAKLLAPVIAKVQREVFKRLSAEERSILLSLLERTAQVK